MTRKIKRQHRTVAAARSKRVPAVVTEASLRCMMGMPVCAVLTDGTVYVGALQSFDAEELTLHGIRSIQKVSSNEAKAKAQISALGGLGPMLGLGGGGGGVLGGNFGGSPTGAAGGGFNLGGMGNWFRIGLGVMQFIFPLMKGFGI